MRSPERDLSDRSLAFARRPVSDWDVASIPLRRVRTATLCSHNHMRFITRFNRHHYLRFVGRRRPATPRLARMAITAAAAFVALAAHVAAIGAQGTDASVMGTIRASNGQPVDAALVIVRNVSTGFQSQQQTRPNGGFLFPQPQAGVRYSF